MRSENVSGTNGTYLSGIFYIKNYFRHPDLRRDDGDFGLRTLHSSLAPLLEAGSQTKRVQTRMALS